MYGQHPWCSGPTPDSAIKYHAWLGFGTLWNAGEFNLMHVGHVQNKCSTLYTIDLVLYFYF